MTVKCNILVYAGFCLIMMDHNCQNHGVIGVLLL